MVATCRRKCRQAPALRETETDGPGRLPNHREINYTPHSTAENDAARLEARRFRHYTILP
jgi:hypothetical protein